MGEELALPGMQGNIRVRQEFGTAGGNLVFPVQLRILMIVIQTLWNQIKQDRLVIVMLT